MQREFKKDEAGKLCLVTTVEVDKAKELDVLNQNIESIEGQIAQLTSSLKEFKTIKADLEKQDA